METCSFKCQWPKFQAFSRLYTFDIASWTNNFLIFHAHYTCTSINVYFMPGCFNSDFRSNSRDFWVQILPGWSRCSYFWYIWGKARSWKLDPGIHNGHISFQSYFQMFWRWKFNSQCICSFLFLLRLGWFRENIL